MPADVQWPDWQTVVQIVLSTLACAALVTTALALLVKYNFGRVGARAHMHKHTVHHNLRNVRHGLVACHVRIFLPVVCSRFAHHFHCRVAQVPVHYTYAAAASRARQRRERRVRRSWCDDNAGQLYFDELNLFESGAFTVCVLPCTNTRTTA